MVRGQEQGDEVCLLQKCGSALAYGGGGVDSTGYGGRCLEGKD